MKKNNYFPGEAAGCTSLGRGEEIIFISTKFASRHISKVIEGAEDRSHGMGKYASRLMLYFTRGSQEIKNEIFSRIITGKPARAVIRLFVKPDAAVLAEFKKAWIPVILRENRQKGAFSIRVDNVTGAFDAPCCL
jgi:DNA-binding LacI/PurR family transcriptional regulator